MRIIAGEKRGMKILPPNGSGTRPILDRVKESIFDCLYKYNLIEDRIIADLFCGTGSFGLEALSRGAKSAVFVDGDRDVIEVLKKNIAKANFIERAKILCSDVFKIALPAGDDGEKYSLLFVDPPYIVSRDSSMNSPLGKLLQRAASRIADDGLAIVRTEKNVNLLGSYGDFSQIDKRTWGQMTVGFYSLRK